MTDTRQRVLADVVVRLALVLVLLGLAAYALSGRRDLDWEAISQRPESAWTTLVLIGLATFALVVFLRTMMGLLRADASSGDEEMPAPEGRRRPLLAQLIGILGATAALVVVYFVLRSAKPQPPRFRDQGRLVGTPGSGDMRHTDPGLSLDHRALLLTVVVAVVLGLAVTVVRRDRTGPQHDLEGEPPDDPDRAALADAVAAAEEELDAHGDDTRAAIIAAYLAMEGQLVAHGTTRQASDTPTDFLMRAVEGSRVSGAAATRLTELFREARFSSHPMPPRAREDAAQALARVAEDLTDARG